MALKDVNTMVLNRLSFIPQTGWETQIGDFQLEQQYYLNEYLPVRKEDAEVEDEANWLGMQRILLAEITAYQLVNREIMKNLAGEDGSTPGSGAKMIKRAKADVVEAEFEYAKAEDGRTLAMKTKELLSELKQNVCRYSQALGFYLPGYCTDIPDAVVQPPFIIKEFE